MTVIGSTGRAEEVRKKKFGVPPGLSSVTRTWTPTT